MPVEAEACTIISTFTPASASSVNTLAAMPGSFGTRRTVASDSVLSCATPEMIGTSGPRSGNRSPKDWLLFSLMFLPLFVKSWFSCDCLRCLAIAECESQISQMFGNVRGSTSSGTISVPRRWEKELRTCNGMSNRCAYSTQRRASTLEPQEDISSIDS